MSTLINVEVGSLPRWARVAVAAWVARRLLARYTRPDQDVLAASLDATERAAGRGGDGFTVEAFEAGRLAGRVRSVVWDLERGPDKWVARLVWAAADTIDNPWAADKVVRLAGRLCGETARGVPALVERLARSAADDGWTDETPVGLDAA